MSPQDKTKYKDEYLCNNLFLLPTSEILSENIAFWSANIRFIYYIISLYYAYIFYTVDQLTTVEQWQAVNPTESHVPPKQQSTDSYFTGCTINGNMGALYAKQLACRNGKRPNIKKQATAQGNVAWQPSSQVAEELLVWTEPNK